MPAQLRNRSDLTNYEDRTPTVMWTAAAVALVAGLMVAHFFLPASGVLALSIPVLVFTGAVNRSIALYPRTYLGAKGAAAAFLVALFLLCDSVGRVGFQIQWRRTFDFTGKWVTFKEENEGWSVSHPAKWTHHPIRAPQAVTVIFKPSRPTPAIDFSVTRRRWSGDRDLARFVENYYRNLPKSAETKILEGAPLVTTQGLEVYRIVHEDPQQTLVLRQANTFLFHGDDLFILSVTAVPSWFERFPRDLRRFSDSLTFNR